MNLKRWLLPAVLAASFCIGAHSSAIAQGAAETSVARQLFREGIELAQAERWDEARDRFERAYALVPRPRIALNLGSAQAQTGQLIESAESYRAFLRTAEENDEPLRAGAEQALADVEARIPHLTLSIDGLDDGDSISIDGSEYPRAALDAEWPLNPGEHELEVLRGGVPISRHRVVLSERQGATIEMTVAPLNPTAAANQTVTGGGATSNSSAVTGPGETSDPDRSLLASPWFWVVFVAVAGGAVAAGILLRPDSQDPFMGNVGMGTVEIP